MFGRCIICCIGGYFLVNCSCDCSLLVLCVGMAFEDVFVVVGLTKNGNGWFCTMQAAHDRLMTLHASFLVFHLTLPTKMHALNATNQKANDKNPSWEWQQQMHLSFTEVSSLCSQLTTFGLQRTTFRTQSRSWSSLVWLRFWMQKVSRQCHRARKLMGADYILWLRDQTRLMFLCSSFFVYCVYILYYVSGA